MKKFWDIILIKEVVGPILISLVSILVYIILKNVVDRVFKIRNKFVDKRKSKTINSLIDNIIKYFIIVVDVVMILDIFGVDTMTLITSLGVLGFVSGLAVQDTLKDFVAGISIILENQYRVGDTITVKGFRGEVIALGIKSTKIRAYTGEVMIISNHLVEEVINHSLEKSLAIVDIPVAYDTDIAKLEEVLRKLLSNIKLDGIRGDIRLMGIQSFLDSSISYRIEADTIPMKHLQIERDLNKVIKNCLDENGIEIPFPQVVVHNG